MNNTTKACYSNYLFKWACNHYWRATIYLCIRLHICKSNAILGKCTETVELQQSPTPGPHTVRKQTITLFFGPYIYPAVYCGINSSFFCSLPSFSTFYTIFCLYLESMCPFFFVSSPTLFAFIDCFLQPFTASSHPIICCSSHHFHFKSVFYFFPSKSFIYLLLTFSSISSSPSLFIFSVLSYSSLAILSLCAVSL